MTPGGARAVEHLAAFDADRVTALREAGTFFWLDLRDPDDATLEAAGRALGIAPLAIEDSREFRQRPKIDDFGDRVLVVFYGARGNALVEVHLHVSGTEVLTVRRGACEALDAVDVRRARSEEDVVYRLLDALGDSVVALVDRAMQEVEALEDAAYDRPTDAERRRIAELRGELFAVRQVVAGQRDMLGRDADRLECVPGLEREEARHPFRDVHDDLVLVANRLDYGRELLAQALDAYLAATSNRLNEVAARLTLVATIFLPLTFVTGFFGQNFEWMVAHVEGFWDFVVLSIGGCLLAVVIPLVYFRRSGLIGRRRS